VSAALQSLFCFHGAEEEESEPHLWTIVFTVDGRTITHTPGAATLNGTPGFFFSPGSHSNLGGGINPDLVERGAGGRMPRRDLLNSGV
jgi:hypothetical protein